MLIKKSKVSFEKIKNKTVLITGAGGGIGYEAARALAYMDLNVIIAEINKDKGILAEKTINEETNSNRVCFYHMDITKEEEIERLYKFVQEKFGCLYAIINNATIAHMGPIDEVDIKKWDQSYEVNIKAPVLLVQKFLPDMKANDEGVIAFVSSSGAAPYMGAYEIFKTAQVELGNTLAGETEDTNIYSYTIGPGLVKTETAESAIETIAKLMKMTNEEFYQLNEKHIIDAESAGVGFALSILLANRYHGQEIGSIQVLKDAGILTDDEEETENNLDENNKENLKILIFNTIKTFTEQYQGWLKRNIFERQWVMRDFKKEVNFSASEFKSKMDYLNNLLNNQDYSQLSTHKHLFEKLKKYYTHQNDLLQKYEKSPSKLLEYTKTINEWIDELSKIIDILK